MKTRVLSGLVMVPLLAILYFGGYVLFAACLCIGLMGVREFYNGFHAIGVKPSYPVACVAAVALYAVELFGGDHREWYMLWFFGVVLASLLYLFKIEERKLEDAMATITGIFYVVFFSFHVTLVDRTDYSLMVWLIVITAFGTDIMAYFSGYLLGKHKLCPKISPKKTIEGSIGGILGSVILSLFPDITSRHWVPMYAWPRRRMRLSFRKSTAASSFSTGTRDSGRSQRWRTVIWSSIPLWGCGDWSLRWLR